MLYLPASESLESLESLLSESDVLVLLALSRLAGPEDTLAPADKLDAECSVQPHISISVLAAFNTKYQRLILQIRWQDIIRNKKMCGTNRSTSTVRPHYRTTLCPLWSCGQAFQRHTCSPSSSQSDQLICSSLLQQLETSSGSPLPQKQVAGSVML